MKIEEPQIDSGANKSVTNDKSILHRFTNIEAIPVFGVEKDEVACTLIGKGFLDLQTSDNSTITICVYYSPECSGTIISPNAVVRDTPSYTSWTQTSHLDTGVAEVSFFNRHNKMIQDKFILHMRNSLWYTQQPYLNIVRKVTPQSCCYLPISNDHPTMINRLNKHTEYELWHQRLLHVGHGCMDALHKCIDGAPRLKRHELRSCNICNEMNVTKRNTSHSVDANINAFAQRFQIDFGFMRAQTDNKKISVRSHDGYNSYLLLVDYYTRYTWVFLTKNKSPPINTVTKFLNTYGNKDGIRIIRTDQGGELARSSAFKEVVHMAGYTLEITGSDNSSQNAIAERPHRTLADMVRAGLENSGLHYKFWSDALLHAVYIKNRLPHAHFHHTTTPYTRLTGKRPNFSNLRVFGCPITTRKPGKRTPKISKHSYTGIFLRYAKTMRNIVYYDTTTRKIKTTTYAKFDEAHFSHSNKPPGARLLMELGIQQLQNTDSSLQLNIVRHHPDAIIPTKGSSQSAGYDLYSISQTTVPSKGIALLDTGISIQLPASTYGRIASRSGLALKHQIETKGGVIDPDYTGTIKVILYNFGTDSYTVSKGERVAQLIPETYANTTIHETDEIPQTARNSNGFGSTGKTTNPTHSTDVPIPQSTPHIIPYDDMDMHTDTPLVNTMTNLNKDQSIQMCTTIAQTSNDIHSSSACDIQMDWHRPIFTTTAQLLNQGNHPTRGLVFKQDEYGLLLTQCIRGTPAAKLPNWRFNLKGSTLHSIDETVIKNIDDVTDFFSNSTNKTFTLKFIQPKPTDIHEDTGLPQLNFDQFLNVAAHHQNILTDNLKVIVDAEIDHDDQIHINKMVKNALTRAKLLKQPDWSKWEQSEFLQLDQYERQNMFGRPGPIPDDVPNPSILPMIWVYIIKVDGRYKARCVANGAPHLKGSLTLAQTYAACLEQSGCRIFWALSAAKNKIIFGADAANAFAEAPPPKSRLWLKVDNAYRNWWKHKHKEDLDPDSYVECFHAIQGHPESPRLWQLHIDKILSDLGFVASHHEPCIYRNTTGQFGEDEIYMLRQVDDFAVACDNPQTAENVWDALDKHLSEPLKREPSYVRRHNGIDIDQSDWFIRVHCKTYIEKICASKPFSFDKIHQKPIPLQSDNDFMAKLETAGNTDLLLIKKLEDEYGFKFRTATGELIFAMVTCRPDIAFAVMKLSQFNNCPANAHFEAIKDIYRYLFATKNEGLVYWRSTRNEHLPSLPFPHPNTESYTLILPPEFHISGLAFCYTDSDYASDRRTRRSVSGITAILNGASIIYKTILQRTIALSSTEAEFYALAEAGKITLYMRSVLNDLNLPQQYATTIYEDNRGCLKMTQAMKPTKRTRHVDTKYFAILNWVETDQIDVKKIDTSDNASDVLTKALGRILFYRHTDTILGRRVPSFVPASP